jgi:hypothetical protein
MYLLLFLAFGLSWAFLTRTFYPNQARGRKNPTIKDNWLKLFSPSIENLHRECDEDVSD